MLKTRPSNWQDIKRDNIAEGLLGPYGVDARTSWRKAEGRETNEKASDERQGARIDQLPYKEHGGDSRALEMQLCELAIQEIAIDLAVRGRGRAITQGEPTARSKQCDVAGVSRTQYKSTQTDVRIPHRLISEGGWQVARHAGHKIASPGKVFEKQESINILQQKIDTQRGAAS